MKTMPPKRIDFPYRKNIRVTEDREWQPHPPKLARPEEDDGLSDFGIFLRDKILPHCLTLKERLARLLKGK